jgi:hypothetical protein
LSARDFSRLSNREPLASRVSVVSTTRFTHSQRLSRLVWPNLAHRDRDGRSLRRADNCHQPMSSSSTIRPSNHQYCSFERFPKAVPATRGQWACSRPTSQFLLSPTMVPIPADSTLFVAAQPSSVPRIVKEMLETHSFDSDQISQVSLSTWSNSRCALVGDATYDRTR